MKKIPPKFSYQDSLAFTKLFVDKLGKGKVSIDTAAKALGFANRRSGLFPVKIGTSKQFGLLEYPSDGQVQASQLYREIQIGDNPKQNLMKALENPNYYDDMIQRYMTGDDLDVSAIAIFVENSYNVSPKDAKKIAQAFVQSMALYPQMSDREDNAEVVNESDEEKNTSTIGSKNQEDRITPAGFVEMPIGKLGMKILFPTEYMPDIISGKFQSGVAELIENEKDTEISLKLGKPEALLNE